MGFRRTIFRRKSRLGEAPPVPAKQEPSAVWLEPILGDVRNLEIPDPDQLDHAFNLYLAELHAPVEKIEQAMNDTILEGREVVQRTLEIAPDFFEKALTRYPLNTGHYIEGGENE